MNNDKNPIFEFELAGSQKDTAALLKILDAGNMCCFFAASGDSYSAGGYMHTVIKMTATEKAIIELYADQHTMSIGEALKTALLEKIDSEWNKDRRS